jgi:hypothetical protein
MRYDRCGMRTMTRLFGSLAIIVALLLPASVPAANADDPCAGFSWNVQHERVLFGSSAQTLAAGTEPAHAPALMPDRLYELRLQPEDAVRYAVSPEKRHPAAAPHGGLVALTVEQPGRYWIALDQAAWVDVISDGTALRSGNFQGQAGCSSPHKIVEFTLPARARLLLQFSGAAEQLRVTITPAAP